MHVEARGYLLELHSTYTKRFFSTYVYNTCISHVFRYLQSSAEGIGSSGIGVTGVCELSNMGTGN